MLDQAAPLEPRELTQALARYPYDRRVFVLPPWEAIYVRDHERDQTFAEAIRVHEAVVAWYGQCGYQTCEVPPGTVSARCAYVLRTLEGRVA